MQVEIKHIDKEKGICRVTYGDERWYFDIANKKNGLPEVVARPSITWIGGHWHKGKEFLRWLVSHNNWEDVESGLAETGARGSKIHNAIEQFFLGEKIKHDMKLLNPNTGEMEEITAREFYHVKTFVDCWKEFKSQYDKVDVLESEKTHLFKGMKGMERGYGCTLDLLLKTQKGKESQVFIVDIKTGSSIWKSASIQLSGIKKALIEEKKVEGIEDAKLFTLQTGYTRNKVKHYKWLEHEYRFDRVQTAYSIWADENKDAQPEQQEFPLELELDIENVNLPHIVGINKEEEILLSK